jgi:predicted RNA binding protein YcfA (HicA-like mRNA interferase family)
MRPLTARQLAAILLANGFVLTRQRGSHQIYRNSATGAMVPLPLHGGNRPIPIGTFLAIVKQSKLPKEAFEK